ncbi:oxidoreductase [Arthrobacter sp. Hiyo6]|nr:oxidoreductase [Arthrobacter sp. Hiyo6]
MDASRESYRRELDLMASAAPLRAAVIGAGYWGPNLARNFKASPDWDLAAIVDMDRDRATKLASAQGNVPVFAPWTSCLTALRSTPSRLQHRPIPITELR